MEKIFVTYKELKTRFLEICAIISEITGFQENRIKPTTTVNYEIGADGFDAWELLDVVVKEYNLNYNNFTLTDYYSQIQNLLTLFGIPPF